MQYIVVPPKLRVVQSPCSTRDVHYNLSDYTCSIKLERDFITQAGSQKTSLPKPIVQDFLLKPSSKRLPAQTYCPLLLLNLPNLNFLSQTYCPGLLLNLANHDILA